MIGNFRHTVMGNSINKNPLNKLFLRTNFHIINLTEGIFQTQDMKEILLDDLLIAQSVASFLEFKEDWR